jgi:hypothetical protein
MWTSGKLARNGGDPALGGRSQLGRIQLVDHLQAAAVEDLVDQPANGRLVGLSHLTLPARRGSI